MKLRERLLTLGIFLEIKVQNKVGELGSDSSDDFYLHSLLSPPSGA